MVNDLISFRSLIPKHGWNNCYGCLMKHIYFEVNSSKVDDKDNCCYKNTTCSFIQQLSLLVPRASHLKHWMVW